MQESHRYLTCSKTGLRRRVESRLFDLTVGAYEGAEVSELAGSFLLCALSLKYNKASIGLYRDDRLAVFRNINGSHSEKIKKEKEVVDFLRVTLNLTDYTYKPYPKPNDEICYIHKESNHSPSITKQLPVSIETRLSKISWNEKVFSESVSIYQEALNKSGHNHKLKFQKISTNNTQRRQRKSNIIWFNRQFSKSIVAKIGTTFLRLIKKRFSLHHKPHKLFDRNNVKAT